MKMICEIYCPVPICKTSKIVKEIIMFWIDLCSAKNFSFKFGNTFFDFITSTEIADIYEEVTIREEKFNAVKNSLKQ